MRRGVPAALLIALALTPWAAAPARAFDTGPHTDTTRDALAAEGFGKTASDIASVGNWFIDFYSNASDIPHSGHSAWHKELLGEAFGSREHWSQAVVDAASNLHFDSRFKEYKDVAGLDAEWRRLVRTTGALARSARDRRNPLDLLLTIGMSLHPLGDFYSHSNWIEPIGVTGADGPDWSKLSFGHTPTWFDVPASARAGLGLYVGGTPGHTRQHGGWNWDRNRSLKQGMNKDWGGRPGYPAAHMATYFAARQWVRAIRAWVGDEAFWRSAQRFAQRFGGQLDHDLWGHEWIGMYTGHWQGQGEPCKPQWSTNVCGDRHGPGGDLLSLRSVNEGYFEDRSRTRFRKRFEELVTVLDERKKPPAAEFPVASSQGLQRTTQFVRLRILDMSGISLGDIGPDDADMYMRAGIAGQRLLSGQINSHDSYSFPRPNAPFEWLKAVPAGGSYGEPVTSLQVEIRTSGARFSGTDDDVHLRIGGSQRFQLDKRLYDDFERGDRDTYSVPIDAAVRAGLTVGDIRRVQIEKSPDGVAGGWKLRGVKLIVNGRTVYSRDGIERWLEDDRRTWRAPDFTPSSPSGAALPVTLDIYDDDTLIYGRHDHGDLDPFGQRKTLALAYAPGPPLQRRVSGGGALGGRRGDGDEARVTYRLETLTPVAAPLPVVTPVTPVVPPVVVQPPPPPPAPKPDLVISEMDFDPMTVSYYFVVKNQGAGAAGPSSATVTNFGSFPVPALAPGATFRQTWAMCANGQFEARADATAQVDESDEANNTRQYMAGCIL